MSSIAPDALELEPALRHAVSVQQLRKSFRAPGDRGGVPLLTGLRVRRQRFAALDGVSFSVGRGEFFGIVGRNGSGKSTLLKCLAGIYDLDAGEIVVDGRLSPFVELGAGFSPELSGRENVLVNGVMLGMTRRQVRERFDQMIAFAELEEFIDLPLKNYSSGMGVRLSFSVATQLDAEILLIDEVLAVGDAAFQRKCFDEFDRLRSEGRTIVLVTHDMKVVQQFCDRALLLEQGRVVEVGAPAEIAARYEQLNLERTSVRLPNPSVDDGGPPRKVYRQRTSAARAGELRRFAEMTLTLARMDFKLRYHGSALGYLWSVMRPVMLFGVIYIVFTHIGRFAAGVKGYGVYVLTALVLWTFFAEATSGAATAILQSQELMRKLRFPRLVIPIASVVKASFTLAMNVFAVIVLIAVSGITPRLSWFELPVLVAILVVLASGLAMLLAAVFVRFRDIAQIWSVVLQLLLFGSGVMYVLTAFPRSVQRAMVANPLAMVFTQMRHALIDPAAPSAAKLAGGALWLALPAAVVVAALALGFIVFRHESAGMAENV